MGFAPVAVCAHMADDETKAQQGAPDLSAMLWGVNDAWRALDHGPTGVQRDVDPERESQRLADGWRRLAELARKVTADEG